MKWTTGILAVAVVSACAGSASAQDLERMKPRIRAPHRAAELGVGVGYTQGFGSVGTVPGKMSNVAGAGVGAGVDGSFRISPQVAAGLSGQFQQFNAPGEGSARGGTVGLQATYHLAPFSRLDPYVTGGAGYRVLWDQPVGPRNDRLLHGPQLAKLKIGLDVRATESLALGPAVGADLSMFLWNNPEGPAGNAMISPKVSTFVYAGLEGRFDLGGRRVLETPTNERMGRR